jgi:hypothetical protein
VTHHAAHWNGVRTSVVGCLPRGRSWITHSRVRTFPPSVSDLNAWPMKFLTGTGHRKTPRDGGAHAQDCSAEPYRPRVSPGWQWHLGGHRQVAGRVIGPGPSAPLVIVMVGRHIGMSGGSVSSENHERAEILRKEAYWTTS